MCLEKYNHVWAYKLSEFSLRITSWCMSRYLKMNPQASRQARNFKQIHKLVHKLDHNSVVFYKDPKFTLKLTQYLGGQLFFWKTYLLSRVRGVPINRDFFLVQGEGIPCFRIERHVHLPFLRKEKFMSFSLFLE